MESFPVLERKQIDRLERMGGSAMIGNLIGLFLEHTPKHLAVIQSVAARPSLGELEAAAHSLKSSAGNLGARELQGLAQALETASGAGETDEAGRLCILLAASYERTRDLLLLERQRVSP